MTATLLDSNVLIDLIGGVNEYAEYRRRGGPRRSLLPDFLIGAHAAVEALPLVTRDPQRYRSYFPTVELITPE